MVVGSAAPDEPSTIQWIGRAADAPEADWAVSVEASAVIPGFVDSHSHLWFAGDRSAEFAARMAGQVYDGGGIGVSVAATREAGDDHLRAALAARVAEMRAQGTTTVEVKSGYGLTVADEERALRLAAEVTDEVTYLGAHVVPAEMRDDRAGYVELVTGEMLAACAPHARWVDVFCEPHSPHAFTGEESREVLVAGRDAGLGLRVHGNQLGESGGVALAVERIVIPPGAERDLPQDPDAAVDALAQHVEVGVGDQRRDRVAHLDRGSAAAEVTTLNVEPGG